MNQFYQELQDKRKDREEFFKSMWDQDIQKADQPKLNDLQKSIDIVIKAHKASKISDELFEKAMGSHKYFKREGAPGSYKYYYTEAEYNQARKDKIDGEGGKEVKTIEEKVIKYLKENNMTLTDRELNDAAETFNSYLSPKQKDNIKALFYKDSAKKEESKEDISNRFLDKLQDMHHHI